MPSEPSRAAPRLARIAAFKPAYLIHGDDHGRLAERRSRLRALAERESGAGGLDLLEGDAATPAAASAALGALTFAMGRRFIIVDGVERWKDAEVAELAGLLASPPPDTTVAFFAREEGRAKAPVALHEAVRKAGGDISAEQTVKSWELPKWVAARARELGLELDQGAAKALVRGVGERQQRLLRELEKLALDYGPHARIGAEEVEEASARSAERRIWTLADAVVARDEEAAVRSLLELRAQGERTAGLSYALVGRLRAARDAVARLDAGESPAQVKKTLRMPPKAADRFLAEARRNDSDGLRRALVALADLEVETRGGGTLEEDTAALRAVRAATA